MQWPALYFGDRGFDSLLEDWQFYYNISWFYNSKVSDKQFYIKLRTDMPWSVFRKVLHSAFLSLLYGTIVKLYLRRNTEVLAENGVPVLLCPPQILHGQARDRKRASVVRGPSNNHLSRDMSCLRIKYSILYINIQFIPHRQSCVSIRKIIRLMLYKETAAVSC